MKFASNTEQSIESQRQPYLIQPTLNSGTRHVTRITAAEREIVTASEIVSSRSHTKLDGVGHINT
jgi:hypothetical protein